MQYTKFGRTGIEVSQLCIGCMGFGDPSTGHPTWTIVEENARHVIKHAIEADINLFQTFKIIS